MPRDATFATYAKAMRAARLFCYVSYSDMPQYAIYQDGTRILSTYREGRLD